MQQGQVRNSFFVILCVWGGWEFAKSCADDLHTAHFTYIFLFNSIKGRDNHIYIPFNWAGMSNQESPCLENKFYLQMFC